MEHKKCEYASSSQSDEKTGDDSFHVEDEDEEEKERPNRDEQGHSSSTEFNQINNNENTLSYYYIKSHIRQNPTKSVSEIGKVIQNSVYIVLAY